MISERIERVLLLILVGLSFYVGWIKGGKSVQAEWDKEKATIAQAAEVRVGAVLQAQQSLQQLIDEGRTDRANAENRIGRLYGAAVDGLRNRPSDRAPDGVPNAASPASGCTGEGLARPDAEFLARYAADAARLQSELAQCRSAYGGAKDRLDALDAAGKVSDGSK